MPAARPGIACRTVSRLCAVCDASSRYVAKSVRAGYAMRHARLEPEQGLQTAQAGYRGQTHPARPPRQLTALASLPEAISQSEDSSMRFPLVPRRPCSVQSRGACCSWQRYARWRLRLSVPGLRACPPPSTLHPSPAHRRQRRSTPRRLGLVWWRRWRRCDHCELSIAERIVSINRGACGVRGRADATEPDTCFLAAGPCSGRDGQPRSAVQCSASAQASRHPARHPCLVPGHMDAHTATTDIGPCACGGAWRCAEQICSTSRRFHRAHRGHVWPSHVERGRSSCEATGLLSQNITPRPPPITALARGHN